jgi:hypothetical protein
MRLAFLLSSVLFVGAAVACGGSSDTLSGPPAAAGGSGGAAGAAATAGASGVDGSAATAGSGGSSDDVATGPTAQQACAQLAASLCERLATCAPAFLAVHYGDPPTCGSRLGPACVKALALPNTVKTPSWTAACAAALSASSCADILLRNTPAACIPPPGPLADGAVCGEDGQCASGLCAYALDQACGHCQKKGAAGGGCTRDDDCDVGLACADNKLCAVIGKAGAGCDKNHPCSPDLSCLGAGSSQGSCTQAGGPGAQCDPKQQTKPGCDASHGLFCNPYTSVCQIVTYAKGGEPCGVVGNGYALCTASAMCKLASAYSGTCLAAAADGAACDATAGPLCVSLAHCVSHVCMPPEPGACK